MSRESGGICLSKFYRRNLEDTLKLIKSFRSGPMKPTQFSQTLGGRGSTESGSFYRKYADLSFYGLVERLNNGDYKFTDIYVAIKKEQYPKAMKEAKIQAFLHQSLFRESIYRQYRGGKIEFNDAVIEEVANSIEKPAAYAKATSKVFVESGVYAEVITKGPGNIVTIKNVDDIIGPPPEEKGVTILKPDKEVSKRPRVERTQVERPVTREVLALPESPVTLGINLNLDGSTTPEFVERVFGLLREVGIGEKRAHRVELHVTEPPLKRELLTAVEQLIRDAREEITIVTPYLDNQVLNVLIPRAKQGIKVNVITRSHKHTKGDEPREAWNHLAEDPKINHQCYDLLHSRMILMDKSVVLVSSADISHDSLEGQFNAGILTDDPIIVQKSTAFIETLLKKAKKSKRP